MNKIPVIFQGKEYKMLVQYASGYCEIVEEREPNNQVKLVHFSEVKIKQLNKPGNTGLIEKELG